MIWWDANLPAIKEVCKGRIGWISKRLGLHRTSLSRKLNGHIRFTRLELNNLAHIVGCNIEDLIIDRSPSKPQRLGADRLANNRG